MHAPPLTRQLAGIVLVVAIPSISCFGWYSQEAAGSGSALVQAIVITAYPAALISLALLVLTLSSAQRSRSRAWSSGLCLVLALAVVLFARS
jgi:uncharacterized membrane protein YhaH (DUF805 family)